MNNDVDKMFMDEDSNGIWKRNEEINTELWITKYIFMD